MSGKRPLRSKLLGFLLLAISLAHGSTPLTNARVRQLGEKLHCQSGCNASVTSCNMINCHFSDPVRNKLLALVEAGKSDKEILGRMEAEYGKQILQKPPAEGFYLLGWVMPFAGAAVGLGIVLLIIKFYLNRRPAPAAALGAAAPETPELAQYKDRIEKDLADLDS